GKIIILTAPSGSGKSTLANRLLQEFPTIHFSVSATTRQARKGEKHGVNYFFISKEDFLEKIDQGEFVEYEEFYGGTMYGTLKSHVEQELNSGYFILLDVEVKGASNIKKLYGSECLSIFVRPPSIESLETRLRKRGSESEETLALRLERARMELEYEHMFDAVVVNEELEKAYSDLKTIVEPYLHSS
ncbi:MAG: guanylate kinase, partial [Balneolales bacterium]|nr:guanylate kinase [Balneolales bacterium]